MKEKKALKFWPFGAVLNADISTSYQITIFLSLTYKQMLASSTKNFFPHISCKIISKCIIHKKSVYLTHIDIKFSYLAISLLTSFSI